MAFFYAGGEFSTLDAEEKKGERRRRQKYGTTLFFDAIVVGSSFGDRIGASIPGSTLAVE